MDLSPQAARPLMAPFAHSKIRHCLSQPCKDRTCERERPIFAPFLPGRAQNYNTGYRLISCKEKKIHRLFCCVLMDSLFIHDRVSTIGRMACMATLGIWWFTLGTLNTFGLSTSTSRLDRRATSNMMYVASLSTSTMYFGFMHFVSEFRCSISVFDDCRFSGEI